MCCGPPQASELLRCIAMPEYPRHLVTFNYVGTFDYFLTFCTFERRVIFVAEEPVQIVHEQVLRACNEEGLLIYVHCYMPDHVHFVIAGQRSDADMKGFVDRAKQYAGFYFKRAAKQRLWQRYGHERVLRDEEERRAFIRYVIQNPVRAGLVESPLDYPFWGSSKWSRDELLDYVRVDRRAG
jgi:putative transposase